MRHHNKNRKFGRVARQRKALLCSLALSLIENEKIHTSESKAKELRPFVEKLISTARRRGVATRRILLSRLLGNKKATEKILSDLSQRYMSRPGGYTRVTKLSSRRGDGSNMAIIEFV